MPVTPINPPLAAARGIDLAARHHEIRKIIAAHFSSSCASAGIDVDDLCQETMLKIHRLNRSPRSAFDPSRGGFAHFVWVMADRLLKTMVQGRARHPLSDYDVHDSVDDRTDPEERLLACEDAAAAAQEGSDAVDEDDDDQILIAATTGAAFVDLEQAVASIQRRQVEPRTRRPAPPPGCKRVQMCFLDAVSSLGEELVAANNNATKESA